MIHNIPFIDKFLSSEIESTNTLALKALKVLLLNLCGDDLENAFIYQDIKKIAEQCQSRYALINLLEILFTPFHEHLNLEKQTLLLIAKIEASAQSQNTEQQETLQKQHQALIKLHRSLIDKHELSLLLDAQQTLSFTAKLPPAFFNAWGFLNHVDPINLSPFVSIHRENNPIICYDGNALSLAHILSPDDHCFLLSDTFPSIYYWEGENLNPHNTHLTTPSPAHEGCTLTPIVTDMTHPDYNFNLNLVNDYLQRLYLISLHPEILTLKRAIAQEYFFEIFTLPSCWLSQEGINILNLIDESVLNREFFQNLASIHAIKDFSGNKTLISMSPLQYLQQIFIEVFPESPRPDDLNAFIEHFKNLQFLDAFIESNAITHVKIENIFSLSDLIKIVIPPQNPMTKKLLDILSQEMRVTLMQSILSKPIAKSHIHALCISSENLLPETQWHFILMRLAADPSLHEDLLNHIKHYYSEQYIKIVCAFLSDKGNRETTLCTRILADNEIKIGVIYHKAYGKNSDFKEIHRQGARFFIDTKSNEFIKTHLNTAIPMNHEFMEIAYRNCHTVFVKDFQRSIAPLIKAYGIQWSKEQNCYLYSGHSDYKKFITNKINALFSELILKMPLMDISAYLAKLQQDISQKESTISLIEELSLPKKLLSTFINDITIKLEAREMFFKTLKEDALFGNDTKIIRLLLNPKIYTHLNNEEFTFFFKHADTLLLAKIIVDYYGEENFCPFSLNNKSSISFNDLAFIVKHSESSEKIDELNKLRFNIGLPINIPEGYVYSGAHYRSEIPLSPEHQYQFESAEMSAAEKILRLKYKKFLKNSPLQAVNENPLFNAIEPIGSLPYQLYLIPAATAHFVMNADNASNEEKEMFEQFKHRLNALINAFNNHPQETPVILCGGIHVDNNHYIPYFIYRHYQHPHAQVLIIDPSADDAPNEENNYKSTKLSAQERLQAHFKELFNHKIFSFIAAPHVTLQYRERDCGPNTIDILENAILSCPTQNPLITLQQGRLTFHESGLRRNGNRERLYDPAIGAYCYSPTFVNECYQMRHYWNQQLTKIEMIDYIGFDDKNPFVEEVVFSEAYDFEQNIHLQHTRDATHDDSSLLTSILISIPAFQESDIMDVIKRNFINTLQFPSEDKLKDLEKLICESEYGENAKNIATKARVRLQELIQRAIINNLMDSFQEALNHHLEKILSKNLSLSYRISYHETPENYLRKIMEENKQFMLLFQRLDTYTQESLKKSWEIIVKKHIDILKFEQAQKDILAYVSEDYINYLELYDRDITHFSESYLNIMFAIPKHHSHEAIKFLKDGKRLSTQFNSSLKSLLGNKIETLLGKIADDIINKFLVRTLSINRAFIDKYYISKSQEFCMFTNNSSNSLALILLRDFKNFSLSQFLLKKLSNDINTRFNESVFQKLKTEIEQTIARFLQKSTLQGAFLQASDDDLATLKEMTVCTDSREMLNHLKKFISVDDETMQLFSAWLDIPLAQAHFIQLFSEKILPIVNPLLESRCSLYRKAIINELIIDQLTPHPLIFDSNLLIEMLDSLPLMMTIPEFIKTHFKNMAEPLIQEAKECITQINILKTEYRKLETLISTPAIACILDIQAVSNFNSINLLFVFEKEDDIVLKCGNLNDEFGQFKQFLIEKIQQKMQENLEQKKVLNNHVLRRALLALTTIETYTVTQEKPPQHFPFFIFHLEDAVHIDKYLISKKLIPNTQYREHNKLLSLREISALEPLPYLCAFVKNEKTLQMTAIKTVPPRNFEFPTFQNRLTLRVLLSTLASWFNLYSIEANNQEALAFIKTLHTIIHPLSLEYKLDAQLPSAYSKKITHTLIDYALKGGSHTGTDNLAYYLLQTHDVKNVLENIQVLSVFFLTFLIKNYHHKNKNLFNMMTILQSKIDTLQLSMCCKANSSKWHSYALFSKLQSTESGIHQFESLLTQLKQINLNYDDDNLTPLQIERLKSFIKEQLLSKTDNDYYLSATLTPWDHLLIGLGRTLLKETKDKEYIFQWLLPTQFRPQHLKDYHYPERCCAVWGETYEDTSINDLDIHKVILLEDGYIVSLDWILEEFKALNRLVNPYTGCDLSYHDINNIFIFKFNASEELRNHWIAHQQSIGKLDINTLSKRSVMALFEYCQDGFFRRGMSGNYNDNENEKWHHAHQKFLDKIGQLSLNERNILNNYPIPVLYESLNSEPLSVVLTQDACITGIMRRLALVIYAYDQPLFSKLNPDLTEAVNQPLITYGIKPETYSDNIVLSLVDRLRFARNSFRENPSDLQFCDCLIQKEEEPQMTFLQRIQRK
jgi:hypothetical protein